ncbi:hypothetical protein LTR64_005945 [Lithohypha guttulata]|uniref:uncharacterized protein n=1 Tax=Lithohypha guttulata TaxID=1690604 RepID=UPI002DDED82D|nr:hypothetical protein LTR51_002257 [Lithohypha guttulata]
MEKRTATTTVSVVDGEKEDHEIDTLSNWLPGYWHRFPFIGATALLCIAVLACIALGVLVGSDGASTTHWPQRVAPSIVLAAINAISSLCLTVAIGDGVAIAWWRRAMKGSTIADLHYQWQLSHGIFANLFTRPRSVLSSKIALAVLAMQVTLLNSILYQRATSTVLAPDLPRNLSAIGIGAEEFPFTGYVVSDTSSAAQTSFMIGDSFIPVVNTFGTSNGFFRGYNELFRFSTDSVQERMDKYGYCSGVCYFDFEAIGFEIDCIDATNHTDIALPAIAAYEADGDPAAWTNIPIFNSSFALKYASDATNYSRIVLNLQYFQSDDPYNPKSTTCPGLVTNKQCSLRPAMVSYPVKVTNFTNEHVINGVSLSVRRTDADDDQSINADVAPPRYNKGLKQVEGFKVVEYLYPQDGKEMRSLTALGGIANAYAQFLSSSAAITYTGDEEWSLDQKGTLAQTMMYGPPNMGSCDCSFRNESLDTILQSVNQLSFLVATGMVDTTTFKSLPHKKETFPAASPSALIVAVDSNTTTSFRASAGGAVQLQDVTHYQTHYVYAGVAFAITIVCIALVIPSYWHYGELGRRVTLGPVEIASAFGAPILIDNSQIRSSEARNETIDTLIKHIGDRKIVYGFVDVNKHGETSHQEMQLQESASTSPHLEALDGLASLRQTTTTGAESPTRSPALNQDDGPAQSKMQKRRSVRLAMGAPEYVRPTSQVFPKSPRVA